MSGRLSDGKRRKDSSQRWLTRQLNDPYVAAAKRQGYRSRAAFKLLELDDRFHILRPGARVVDLGAAPGGWTQAAVQRARAGEHPRARVVAIDLTPMQGIEGAEIVTADAEDADLTARVLTLLGGPADVVLSDMAPKASGHRSADHLRIIALAETAAAAAEELLAEGGGFVCKVWQGGAETALLAQLKYLFATVRHAKPPASRADSAEIYLVAQCFRGRRDPA
ncbi:Ribosomal RNA large subunit methyltransferase E [Candidatus Defluviicoccus seviourii]|uniref:Ribosomal RNA large subunit methyltransferase E n=2 Tax=root TaxID=1 RepID=A0A564WFB1_9PROT|nr:Ribosomal RNA large subunit methyltransferase E [uncultured Defluviicoccus sp.]VUX47170.1 Ribosomal RNA large subunit methyltransferase E [Candidatus Defluviicoccus seviourii]